ncbi:hypothetical protein VNO77_44358 [Canavalia gladiata]|uniref:Glycosyltransferase n=1 Tax=Canavalia gladiata TaxID=3824 RepID=A0AAN9JY28_CANGL
MVHHRFLIVTYPLQGHINPAIHFAKRLVAMGVDVTFATSARRMFHKPTIPGLSFATIPDGSDDGGKVGDIGWYMSELRRRGSECVRNMITATAEEGRPFTCVAYTPLLAWVAEVAREFQLPRALLWIQPATVFDIYYHYLHDCDNEYLSLKSEDPTSIELPGLPFSVSLTKRDLPSFILPSNAYAWALPSFKEQFKELDHETKPRILVNTFEELEPEALRAFDNLTMVPIGPLIPSPLDGKDLSHTADDYLQWLDSKPRLSVVYVSFGTLAVLPMKQMEEVARALLDGGYPFLWAIKEKAEELSCIEELEQRGKVVKWCSQVEVLSHPSLGCFVTHCGWNSTMEGLASGVPMVGFPQWTDQTTNAKLLEDLWKAGVRLDDKVNEEGMVEAEEIRMCLELVMGTGEKGQELRKNANRWKSLAWKAVEEGGSSATNMRTFLDDLGK